MEIKTVKNIIRILFAAYILAGIVIAFKVDIKIAIVAISVLLLINALCYAVIAKMEKKLNEKTGKR
jgi:hypothetical protein